MFIHTRASALLLSVIATAIAQAQDVPQEPPPADAPKLDFAAVDEDRDGNISKQEAIAVADLHASFDVLDVDRNQALSPTEFARFSRAGSSAPRIPRDPTTAPGGGSAGAQHLPDRQ